MLLRSACAAVEPDEMGTRSRTASGVLATVECLFRPIQIRAAWRLVPRRVREAGGAGADDRTGGVVPVIEPPLAVVVDQLGVGLDGVGDVRGEKRVAVAARSTESRLVALPCHIRIGCCSGCGHISASLSSGRNRGAAVTLSWRQICRKSW